MITTSIYVHIDIDYMFFIEALRVSQIHGIDSFIWKYKQLTFDVYLVPREYLVLSEPRENVDTVARLDHRDPLETTEKMDLLVQW